MLTTTILFTTMRFLFVLALLGGSLALSSCQQAQQLLNETTAANTSGMEPGIDRYGSDYRSFDVNHGGPVVCQRACRADTACRAWTHTAPGYQSAGGMCFLKDAIPGRSSLREATSGVIRP